MEKIRDKRSIINIKKNSRRKMEWMVGGCAEDGLPP